MDFAFFSPKQVPVALSAERILYGIFAELPDYFLSLKLHKERTFPIGLRACGDSGQISLAQSLQYNFQLSSFFKR